MLVILLALISLVGWKYYSMSSTIEEQAIMIDNRNVKINVLTNNIEDLKESHDREVAKLKAEVKIVAKKKEIEKDIDYDKSTNSRSINSTYIDLP